MDENKYIHIIDADGVRVTSLVIDILTTEEKVLEQAKKQFPNHVYITGDDAMLDNFMQNKKYKDGKFEDILPYVPTKEEKINAIKSEYEQRFKKLEVAQQRLLLIGKPTDAIRTQYMNLMSEMVARIKEVQ